ncbi:MAG TPA: porin [Candidatus Thiothrix moscowensis]|mgnify:CR=1 FL=1|uniref:porin n=1 Tax=unclassified Thiothrix TaxID=2636184 RepID=UPI0025F05159|nr:MULTISPECIES: porin [unclassified Thiothrix]HRJ53795.1 porin [Candidatus Thiothrix moscowensis]HRJ93877.1 porin [Candidatus Thiothrix moscowensis]
MKKLLVIAVAAGLIAPAAAMADTTLYGKLHASVGSVKNDNGAGVTSTETGVESHSSRFGIKGSTALDNGMSATYGLEYGVDLDGDNGGSAIAGGNVGTAASNPGLSSRNQFVGLKGGFGEVRVGKHDTPAKLATAGQDIFADSYADMANIITSDADRVNNAVAYINKFGPVGVAVAHSTGITAGDIDVAAGVNAGTVSAAGVAQAGAAVVSKEANTAMVNYSNGPWYAGLGHTAVSKTAKKTNLGLGWKAEAGHQANLVYEKVDFANTQNDGTNVLLNGAYKMGNVTLKGQVGEAKIKNAGKEKLTSVAADYSLGKKTSVYLLHSINKNPTAVLNGQAKNTATAVGLVTEF